jgi:DNA-directed RNA polymerase subunit RPC12/RpoP
MSTEYRCYRCGESLAALTLPFSRRDACPACSVHLHVCRMCEYFDPAVVRQCREDDAEEVKEKERVNFCEWFKPCAEAFDPRRANKDAQARSDLAALFGEGEEKTQSDDDQLRKVEDLFR